MDLRPGYKQTEIGSIPEDWDVAPLGAICAMKSGEGITSASIRDFGPFPVFGGNGLRGFTTRFTHDGDFALVGRQGALCGNVYGVSGRFFASEHAVVVTPQNGTSIAWLTRVLKRMELNQYSESSAQPGLSVQKILRLQVAFPPISEQKAIAEALSNIDAAINQSSELISKKRDLRTAAMQQLLSGRTRLAAYSKASIGYKQTEIGNIPTDWDLVNLGSIGESLIGLTYAPTDVRSNGTLVLRSSNIQNDTLAFANNVFVEKLIPQKIMVRPGDVLICVRNGSVDLIGKSALLDERTVGMTFGAFMAVYRSEIGRLINYHFQSSSMKKQIKEHLGATINQITNKSLNSFRIPLSRNKQEQHDIADVLSDMDAEITALEARLEKTRALKQGMMQTLLTGRVRLPVQAEALDPLEVSHA
ncbi:Type-1 restriction enzyme EcoKI specificity protein [Defluviimonas aquaemixtae]|uniref:Type-1 restriction enzyme EcoKI specificity protein n=1 Tax=Albidovulum aquaemixtae TaxID=1542388 RepID=A0A2R8BKH3_9RHOB|nr:restriction endonuclease subunit S [Defluviimonas aquaemixtae]SPH23897.1 Type-1 restriction enzyme EcoKI specificity protein [Defluviimonas aquaemixtae]